MQITVEQSYYLKPHHVKAIAKVIDESNRKVKLTYFLNDKRQSDWFTFDQLDEWKSKRNPEVKQRKEEIRKRDVVYFAKIDPKSDARIPSKRHEDAGRDVYCCFEKDEFLLPKNKPTLIPTGIASACDPKYYLNFKHERGSTGLLGMAVLSGVVDSGYRNEIFVNVTPLYKDIVISKTYKFPVKEGKIKPVELEDKIMYPYSLAVAQFTVDFVPNVDVEEIPYHKLKQIKSLRGMSNLGASGK